jgi:hypothetical protein
MWSEQDLNFQPRFSSGRRQPAVHIRVCPLRATAAGHQIGQRIVQRKGPANGKAQDALREVLRSWTCAQRMSQNRSAIEIP